MANAEIEMGAEIDISDSRNDDFNKRKSLAKRYFWSSALARRIIAFNLIALCVLLLGMLYLSQFHNNSTSEHLTALETETTLYTQIISERLSNDTSGVLSLGAKVKNLPMSEVSEVRIYDAGSKPVITLLSNTKYGV
jgi:hypothetical protein